MKRLCGTTSRAMFAIVVLVSATIARRAVAQQPPAATSAAACGDAVPSSALAITLSPDTLYAVVELGYQAPDTAKLYAAYLADAFAREFRPPVPFGFSVWRSPERTADYTAVPALGAEVMIVIRPNGELRRLAFSQTSLVPAIDAALEAGLRSAVRDAAIPRPSELRIGKDLTLFFAITLDPNPVLPGPPPDGMPARTKPLTPDRRTVQQPLLILQLPTAWFSSPVLENRKDSKPVRFPPDLLSRSRDGDVTIQYVVGRDGRITPGTVRLLGATERGFAAGVFEAVDGLRFVPGQIAGCPVPVLVTQSFSFRIGRR